MPQYMDVHDGFVGATKEQLAQAHAADVAIQDDEHHRPVRAVVET